jgi:replication factor A1
MEIRTWDNAKGSGKLFNADFIDEAGTQIRATFFNAQVDKFFPILVKNNVYAISKFYLKAANRKFSTIPNDYELSIVEDSEVVPVVEDAAIKITIPLQTFALKKIGDIKDCKVNDVIDVAGIISSVGDFRTGMSKTGKETFRRVVTIMDDSNHSIDLTVWGKEHEATFQPENCLYRIVAVKNCTVTSFMDKASLNTSFSSSVYVNFAGKDVAALSAWWSSHAQDRDDMRIDKVTTLASCVTGGIEGGAPPDGEKKTTLQITELKPAATETVYNLVVANVMDFKCESTLEEGKSSWHYKACPGDGCLKKLSTSNFCEKCQKTYPSGGIPKYTLRLLINDHTGAVICTAFDSMAQKLLGGVTADDMAIFEFDKNPKFKMTLAENMGKCYLFKIQTKMDTFQSIPRPRHSIVGLWPAVASTIKEEKKV